MRTKSETKSFTVMMKRNMWVGLVTFLLVFGALAFSAFNSDKIYQARALILFTLGREYVYVPENNQVGVKAPNLGDFQGVVNAEMLLLDDPALRKKAISAVGLDRAYPGIAAAEPEVYEGLDSADMRLSMASDALKASADVSLVTGSYVVSVKILHANALIAAELTNALTDAYLGKRWEIYSEREIESLSNRIDIAEKQAEKIDIEISDLLDGRDPILYRNVFEGALQHHANFEAGLAAAQVDLAVLLESQVVIEAQLAEIDPSIEELRELKPDPLWQEQMTLLTGLKTEYNRAVVQFGSSHPTSIGLNDQIQRLEGSIPDEALEVTIQRQIGPNPVWNAIERRRVEIAIEVEGVRRRIKYLQTSLDSVNKEVAQYSQVMPMLSRLEQGRTSQTSRIVSLQSRLRESLSEPENNQIDNVHVIQKAVPATSSANMPLKTRLVIAFGTALITGVASILGLGLLRSDKIPEEAGTRSVSALRPKVDVVSTKSIEGPKLSSRS